MYMLWSARPECAGDSLQLKFFSHSFFFPETLVGVQVVVECMWLCSVWWFCLCMYYPSQALLISKAVQEAGQETIEVHKEISLHLNVHTP